MSLGTMEQRTEGMKRQAQELIDQAYNRGFKAGYENAKENIKSDTESRVAELMEVGRNEAWEAVGKLVSMDYRERYKVLGDFTMDWLYDYSASEAIEKLKAWEQKKQE